MKLFTIASLCYQTRLATSINACIGNCILPQTFLLRVRRVKMGMFKAGFFIYDLYVYFVLYCIGLFWIQFVPFVSVG